MESSRERAGECRWPPALIPGGGGGFFSVFLVGVCCPGPQILTRFQTKKRNFPHPFSDLAFRHKLCYHYVAVRAQTKNSSNPFQIRIFLFLSYSFGIKTINTFINSVVPSKTIPDSRPKWAKCIPVFRPKRRKNPTWWGGTYVYGLYKGVPPPPRAKTPPSLSCC